MIEQITGYIELALVIIGALAALAKSLEVIAGITPSTKDDEYAAKFTRALGVVAYWLDKLSLAVNDKAKK